MSHLWTEREFRPINDEELAAFGLDLEVLGLNVSQDFIDFSQKIIEALNEPDSPPVVIPFDSSFSEKGLRGIASTLQWTAETLTARKMQTEIGSVENASGQEVPGIAICYQKPVVLPIK